MAADAAAQTVQCGRSGDVLVVRLARPRANALNGTLVDELTGAVRRAAADPEVRGLVLASALPRIFSAGFDVAEVFGYDRAAMTAFFGRFIDLYQALASLPKPVVAAIGGHAVAGGAVLALTADLRVWAEGDHEFALNEVSLGVVLPPNIVRLALAAAGPAAARELLLTGAPIPPARALALGLAQEVAPPAALLERALARAGELAQKPPGAFAAVKQSLRAAAGLDGASDRGALDAFIAHWFSDEAVAARRALRERLARR